MKHGAWAMVLALLAASGCVTYPVIEEGPPPAPAAFTEQATPPVTADQVTEENAAEMAHRLEVELERERGTAPGAPRR